MSAVIDRPSFDRPSLHKHRWPDGESALAFEGGVYIFHGLGEHGARYAHVAQWFVDKGYRVGSHDHPAHGRSPGERGILQDDAIENNAVEQFEAFQRTCDGPVLLLGHSLGGALAANLVLRGVVQPDALILSAPAFEPNLSAFQRAQLSLMFFLAKDLTVTAPLSGPLLTHDEQIRKAWLADPLINRIVSARLIKWLVDTGEQALEMAPRLSIPTLLLVPLADVIVKPAGSDEFARRAPTDKVMLHTYEGLYHELLNETPQDRQRVFAHIDQWLEELVVQQSVHSAP
ncbi:MAG: lysophospholipase [Burkholderiaceae bacterium]